MDGRSAGGRIATGVARWIAAALACSAAALTMAQELSLQQADGKLVAVVDDGTAGPFHQQLERRQADGRPDTSFGRGGRVAFSLGTDSLGPSSLRADPRGRLLVVGSAYGADDRSAPVTLRFTPDGRADATWGFQGRGVVPWPDGDALGVDVLATADEGVLVLGQVESRRGEQVALWRLRSDGSVDGTFGRAGMRLARSLDHAQPLNLQGDDDGSALIAVQTQAQGRTWLEVHRWPQGLAEPELVARQLAPLEWQGQPRLERGSGGWQWVSSHAGMSRMAVVGVGAWANPSPAAAVAEAGESTATSGGAAAFNPFAAEPVRSMPAPEAADDNLGWPLWALGLGATLVALAWWQLRRPRSVDIGLLNPLDSQIDEAVRSIGRAQPRRAEGGQPPVRPWTPAETTATQPAADVAPVAEIAPVADAQLAPAPAPAIEPPVTAHEPAALAGASHSRDGGGCRNRLPDAIYGQPDDLRRIKGVGPVLEKWLHGQGVYYFWQIAQWNRDDVIDVETRMTSFKRRVERDDWVAQAIELAQRPESVRSPRAA